MIAIYCRTFFDWAENVSGGERRRHGGTLAADTKSGVCIRRPRALFFILS